MLLHTDINNLHFNQTIHSSYDWLSYEWKGKTLYLHWIETNLERRNKIPSLTRNERRFKEAIQSGKVVNEYHSMWIDADGRNHWEGAPPGARHI